MHAPTGDPVTIRPPNSPLSHRIQRARRVSLYAGAYIWG